jgi:hypothetical protein
MLKPGSHVADVAAGAHEVCTTSPGPPNNSGSLAQSGSGGEPHPIGLGGEPHSIGLGPDPVHGKPVRGKLGVG